MKKPKLILSIVLLVGLVWYFAGGGLESHAASEMNNIENQVALDAEKQYDIAKRSGNAIDTYVHAGLVAAAYLQAKDEANYSKWKEIEKHDAKAAGMTLPE
jgi:hypothetical protein